jgi:hypothetical protein
MTRRHAPHLICAAWLAASAALAQSASSPASGDAMSRTVSPLTIQAPPSPKVIHRQAESFVQSYAATANPNVEQIARWHGPVCVQVWGLPLAEQAAKIKARIDGMAQALGLPAARAGCKTNVEIVFTPKPQSLVDSIARRWQPLLGYYHLSDTRRLKTVTHPIQAWYSTATRSEGVDVADVLFSQLPQSPVPASPTGVADDPTNAPPVGCFDRFTACYKSLFHNVLIVADSKALEDEPLRLVADDMVMLALSQPKSLDGCNVLPSVIDHFARSRCHGRAPPTGLTPADAAYLGALYAAEADGKKRFDESDIADRMAKILIKDDSAPAPGPPDDRRADRRAVLFLRRSPPA